MQRPLFVPLPDYHEYPQEEMIQRSADFYDEIRKRRSVRQFSSRSVPEEIIANCIQAAGSAPSGANMQPWYFVVVTNPQIKQRIRLAAEAEEHEFYQQRAPKDWLAALGPLGTDEHKPFLETAPYLIAIFVQSYGLLPTGKKVKHYYALESVGIATGILITALHHAGLATLTHTPSPMNFLNQILDRPPNEKPFLLLVTGYPDEKAKVPVIPRKSLEEIASF